MFNEHTWKDGEKIAQEYMKKQGYKILYTNFSCVGVELDIIAILPKKVQIKKLKKEYKEKLKNANLLKNRRILRQNLKNIKNSLSDLLIITEVKARQNNNFGQGFESVTQTKQKNIIRGARYLMTKKEFSNLQIRFDVASVDAGKLTYFENAFSA